MFVLVTVLCCWLGYSMNWIRQRHAWLAEHRTGIIEVVPAPAGLWLFGDTGVEYLWDGRDIENGHRLFPEAKVARVVPYPGDLRKLPRIEISPYSATAPNAP